MFEVALLGCMQDTQSNGKIVRSTFFAYVCWGKINYHTLTRHGITSVFEDGFDPMLAFFDSAIRKAYHKKVGPLNNVHLNRNH